MALRSANCAPDLRYSLTFSVIFSTDVACLLAVRQIADALLGATSPLLITSHLGRNHQAFPALATLSRILALPVFLTCPSATNLPTSHPYLVGYSYLIPGTQTPLLKSADVVLVVDAEVAWIPMNKDKDGGYERPSETARVYVIDSGDPLRRGIGMQHGDADLVCHAGGVKPTDAYISPCSLSPNRHCGSPTHTTCPVNRQLAMTSFCPSS